MIVNSVFVQSKIRRQAPQEALLAEGILVRLDDLVRYDCSYLVRGRLVDASFVHSVRLGVGHVQSR
jgi:hypothetical protein